MSIGLTDELEVKTKKGKLAAAKQIFLEGDKETVQQIGDKTHQLEDAFKDIAVSGGASTANAVSYNNEASGMTAITAQAAIDELAAKKFDKESILQELGDSEDKVMSQKAVSDKLSGLATKTEHVMNAYSSNEEELLSVSNNQGDNIVEIGKDNVNVKHLTVDNEEVAIYKPKLLLPNTCCFCVGHQYMISKKLLFDNTYNSSMSVCVTAAAKLQDFDDFVLFVPENNSDVNKLSPFSIFVYNPFCSIGMSEKSIQIKKKILNSSEKKGKTVNILALGDSYTELSWWLEGIDELAKKDGISINWCGTMPADTNKSVKSENQTGGTLAGCFMGDRSKSTGLEHCGSTYLVYVENVQNKNMKVLYNNYVVYSINNTSWRVKGYKLDDNGNGYIVITNNSGDIDEIPNEGTLSLISGTGDSTITYTSIKEVNGNPLWNPETSKIDFAYFEDTFMQNTPDIVLLQFCWNDIGINMFKVTLNNVIKFINNLKEFISTLLEQKPNVKIIFSVEPMGATKNICASGICIENLKYVRSELTLRLFEEYKNNENIAIVPSFIFVDGEFGITRKEVNAIERFSDVKFSVPYGANGDNKDYIHCNKSGMKQISDAVYPYLINFIK